MAALVSDEDTRVYEVIDEEYLVQHGHCAGSPVTGLGSGDSRLFLDVLPADLLEADAFDTMNAEIDWNVMNHKGDECVCLLEVMFNYWCINFFSMLVDVWSKGSQVPRLISIQVFILRQFSCLMFVSIYLHFFFIYIYDNGKYPPPCSPQHNTTVHHSIHLHVFMLLGAGPGFGWCTPIVPPPCRPATRARAVYAPRRQV